MRHGSILACGIGLSILVASIILTSLTVAGESFELSNWRFTWLVAEKGSVRIDLDLTPDRLTIDLRETEIMGDSLWLLPSEAAAIGRVLVSNTDKYWKAMKNAKQDMSKTLKAGKYKITYSQNVKYGFSVHIRPDEDFSMSSIMLERDQAELLGSHLAKAEAMARFARENIHIGPVAKQISMRGHKSLQLITGSPSVRRR